LTNRAFFYTLLIANVSIADSYLQGLSSFVTLASANWRTIHLAQMNLHTSKASIV